MLELWPSCPTAERVVPGLEGSGTCLAKRVCRRMGVGLGAKKARVRILSQPLISRGTWGEFLYSPELSFPSRGKMAITPEGQRLGLCSFYLNSQFLAWSRSSVDICGVDE